MIKSLSVSVTSSTYSLPISVSFPVGTSDTQLFNYYISGFNYAITNFNVNIVDSFDTVQVSVLDIGLNSFTDKKSNNSVHNTYVPIPFSHFRQGTSPYNHKILQKDSLIYIGTGVKVSQVRHAVQFISGGIVYDSSVLGGSSGGSFYIQALPVLSQPISVFTERVPS